MRNARTLLLAVATLLLDAVSEGSMVDTLLTPEPLGADPRTPLGWTAELIVDGTLDDLLHTAGLVLDGLEVGQLHVESPKISFEVCHPGESSRHPFHDLSGLSEGLGWIHPCGLFVLNASPIGHCQLIEQFKSRGGLLQGSIQ